MSTDTTATAETPALNQGLPDAPSNSRRLVIYLTLMLAVFMSMMDIQIVSTALPTIVGEFGHFEWFPWVGSAYLLTSSAVMPIYGKLGDLFGRKYIILFVVSLFTLGSLVCGLATSMETLIAARVLQALGGGGITVTVFSINADLFNPRERAKYQSYTSLVLMMAGAIGPTLGGFLTDLFGWRSIFLVNLPIGILVLTALCFLLPNRRPNRKPKIDFAGAILLTVAIASIVLWADSSEFFGGLTHPLSLSILGIGALSAVGWVLVERVAPEPIIPLYLFKNRTISLLWIISILSGCLGIGLVNHYAVFLQNGLGLSPSQAGVLFIPLTTGIAIGAVNAGRIMSKIGNYKYFSTTSLSVTALGMLLMQTVSQDTSIYVLAGMFLLNGIGVGIGQQVPTLGVQNAAPHRDVGTATGATSLTRIGGASIAIAIYGAIVTHGVRSFTGSIPGVEDVLAITPNALAALPLDTQHLVNQVYLDACLNVFMVTVGIALTGALCSLFLPNLKLAFQNKGAKD